MRLPNERERGEAFEEFCQAFFLLNPIFQFTKVYRQNEIPHSLRQQLGYPGTQDIGIDGLGQTDDGKLIAYQAKFRTDRSNIPTLRELSTFFTVSDRADWRITITNANSVPRSLNDRRNSSRVLSDRLEQLDPDFFDRLRRFLKERTVTPPAAKVPHKTQQEAIYAALTHFKGHDRGQLILPCGTGKTLAAMWIAENLGGKRFLVMVPSLALMSQTLREWAANASFSPFRYLCLCSDTTVGLEDDSPIEHLYEMDVPVTTEVATVSDFLSSDSATLLLFSTYQSSKVLSEAVLKTGVKFDVAIFDEAHRTTGTKAGLWNLALDDRNVPAKKRLFMTATPRIYAPHIVRKARDEDILICSMDDQEIYGKPFYEVTFGEAITREHITDYKVVVICVTDSEVKDIIERGRRVVTQERYEWDAKALAKRVALGKAINVYGLKKVFTFHGKVRGAKAFTDTSTPYGIRDVLKVLGPGDTGNIKFFHVNGTMSAGVRNGLLNEFREAEIGIMSNARCLTEGVDVPVVDTVAFIDPKRSLIDIVQATGRALRKAEWKGKGYIFIPIVVQEGAEPEQIIENSDFETVWQVLEAMVDQDQRLESIVSRLRVMQGKGEEGTQAWREAMAEYAEKVEFYNLPVKIDNARFLNALYARVIEVTGKNWDFYYGLLLRFRKQFPNRWPVFGDVYDGYKIGVWCGNQRRRKERLAPGQICLLDSIRFPWEPFEPDLWSSSELAERLGVSHRSVIKWVEKTEIEPVQTYKGGKMNYYFFKPGYDEEVKKHFGITLEKTDGLLSINDLAKALRFHPNTIYRLINQNKIKPRGRAFIAGGKGIAVFFSPDAVAAAKKELGITITDRLGLLTPSELAKKLNVDTGTLYKWVNKGIIVPFGKGYQSSGRGVGYFFHPNQVPEFKKKLGITLENIKGLLSVGALARELGLKSPETINKWIKDGKVIPFGYAFGRSGLQAYFHQNQAEEIRKSFGVTLRDTKDLLTSEDLAKALGLVSGRSRMTVNKWVREGKMKPHGYGFGYAGVVAYFHPKQVRAIRKQFGVNLSGRKGLMSLQELAEASGVHPSTICKWIQRKEITPAGKYWTPRGKGVGYFFKRNCIGQIGKRLRHLRNNKSFGEQETRA